MSGDPRRRTEKHRHATTQNGVVADWRLLDPDLTAAELAAIRPTCGECGAQGRFINTRDDMARHVHATPQEAAEIPPPPDGARYFGCDACGAVGLTGLSAASTEQA